MGFCLLSLSATAASDRDYIRHGNHLYRDKDFEGALGEYTKAIGKNEDNPIAHFNAGCVQIQLCDKVTILNDKLKADSAALIEFEAAIEHFSNDRAKRGFAYHNIGVIYHKDYYYYEEAAETFRHQNDMQDAQLCEQNKITALEKAINEYKCALRCNPKDDETRYNLALCQYLLKKNQKNNKNQNQNNNQDKNKDNKNNQDKNRPDENKDDNQDKNKNNKKPQPLDGQMSHDNAEQLLNAARQQEEQTQQRLKRQAARKVQSKEKNW